MSGVDGPYVLVGGWPGSGKTTLARALAPELGLAYLGKDDLKESLWEQLGAPTSVEDSRRLGEAAVRILLRLARDCPGAVIDSTWYAYTRPLVAQLPGRIVEVRCLVSIETARARYAARRRGAGHLDDQRTEAELWGQTRRAARCRAVGRGRHRGTGGRRGDRRDDHGGPASRGR